MEEENSSVSKSSTNLNRKSEERIFNDMLNEALIGLDVVVDEANIYIDNDDFNKPKQHSKSPSDDKQHQNSLLQHSSTDQYDKKEITSRRDFSKTKRDILKDRDRLAKKLEAKIAEKKIKVSMNGSCSSGIKDNVISNLDEFNITSKQDVFLKTIKKKSSTNDLKKQRSPIRKSSVKSTSRRRSPSYGRYRSSERFSNFKRFNRRSNVSRYSPDRYRSERQNYKSRYRPLGKRISRSPSLTLSSGSDVSVRETWLASRQFKIRRSKSPYREKRKPFIEEIKRQLEETKQFQEASQIINRLPPQSNLYPSGYQHFPPMQNNYQQPVINAPSVLPPMCPNPFANIPHPNMNISHEMNAFNPNIMSYSETHVPPHEMNILPFNVRVPDVPSVLLRNQNSEKYPSNSDLIPPNSTHSLPTFSNHLPIIKKNPALYTHELNGTSTNTTTRLKSNEEENTMSKLFQDKKIKIPDFLAATVAKDSSCSNIQQKIEVISRCQDAIKNLSFDLNNPTRFVPTSLYSDIKKPTENNNKWLSPLEKIPTVSLPFTEDSNKKALIHDQLQKLLAKLWLPALVVGDSPTSLPQSGTNKSNLFTKEVQTDSYKCQMCEFYKENKKNQSVQTEMSLTYDVSVQVNMEDIFNDCRSQGKTKSISHMTAAQLLQTCELEKNNRQSSLSDVDTQTRLDSLNSDTLNTPHTIFSNNQPKPSLFSNESNWGVDLKLNNSSNSVNYFKNNQIIPSMCPSPYDKNIPNSNVNIQNSNTNIIHADVEMNTSSSKTYVPPCEKNSLSDVPNALLQNQVTNQLKGSKQNDIPNPINLTADEQFKDPEVRRIIDKVKTGHYTLYYALYHNGLLVRLLGKNGQAMKYLVPDAQKRRLILHFHIEESTHISLSKTFRNAIKSYWWKDMYKDAIHYVKSCKGCTHANDKV